MLTKNQVITIDRYNEHKVTSFWRKATENSVKIIKRTRH